MDFALTDASGTVDTAGEDFTADAATNTALAFDGALGAGGGG